MIPILRKRFMITMILVVGTCCVVQQLYSISNNGRPLFTLPKHFLKMEVKLRVSAFVRDLGLNEDDYRLPKNSNMKNVEYNNGVFGRTLSSDEDKVISERCKALAAVQFVKSPLPLNETNTCFQPLPTNTTCCFCYVSSDGEEIVEAKTYKYWSCAVPRENSLLPANSTPVDSQGAKVALLTGKFGYNNRFRKSVEKFCQNVREMNLVDPQDIWCYWESPEYVLQNKKFSRHLRYRTDPTDVSAKGGGYWVHKALIIRHHLDLFQDGDFLVWTDVDRIDVFQLGTFQAVVEKLVKSGDDLGIDVLAPFKESLWTKADVLAAFNASPSMRDAPQVSANFVVMRNSPSMKRLAYAWVECVADWHMVSDDPSVLPKAPGRVRHRHDQSILGLLIRSFLKMHSVVGPPARTFWHHSEIVTFAFQDGADPSCPFSSFYAEQFMAQRTSCK